MYLHFGNDLFLAFCYFPKEKHKIRNSGYLEYINTGTTVLCVLFMSDSEDEAKEEQRELCATAQKSQNRPKLADEAGGRSPEKVQVKRARPNPPLSLAKPINIASQSSAVPSHPSLEEKLPLWVAGKWLFLVKSVY